MENNIAQQTYKNNKEIVAKRNGSGTFLRLPDFLIWLIDKNGNKNPQRRKARA